MSMDFTSSLSENLADLAERLRASVVLVHEGGRGIGSGIVWRTSAPDVAGETDATIITNAHVVRAAGTKTLTLQLADNRKIEGTLVAIDPAHDLAALQARASGLQPAEIGNSAELHVGELVVAVGNPFGHTGAMTVGVVAARAPADPSIRLEPVEPTRQAETRAMAAPGGREPGRERGRLEELNLIQADIRLYPGNSGGPLADARGRVVGVNSMVGGGLGFAIPSRVVEQFLTEASQTPTQGYLGVQVLTVPVQATLRQRLNISQESAA